MKIILMETSNLAAFSIPYVPEGTRISLDEKANDNKDTINGRIRIMGNKALRKLSWSSFFPVKNTTNFKPYSAHLNGYAYVIFLETMRKLEFPIRVIGLSNQGVPIFNFLASIDKFTWGMDRSDNINYEIELTEFPERFWNFIDRDIDVAQNIRKEIGKNQQLKRLGLLIKNIGY